MTTEAFAPSLPSAAPPLPRARARRSAAPAALPWPSRLLLLQPGRIGASLERVRGSGALPASEVPNLFQLSLGVLRMWHRVLYRPETIGTCAESPVRDTWRARMLEHRPLRFPFLVAERAIAPLDFSGLASSPERILRHLLGAHHDRRQFVYDLELLATNEGCLAELVRRAREVVEHDTPRSRWLRDLTVYEGYHESLLAAAQAALEGRVELPPDEADDPDISFHAYLRWCARQPPSLDATLEAFRRGAFTVANGLEDPPPC